VESDKVFDISVEIWRDQEKQAMLLFDGVRGDAVKWQIELDAASKHPHIGPR
jgi:hypothetical protein